MKAALDFRIHCSEEDEFPSPTATPANVSVRIQTVDSEESAGEKCVVVLLQEAIR